MTTNDLLEAERLVVAMRQRLRDNRTDAETLVKLTATAGVQLRHCAGGLAKITDVSVRGATETLATVRTALGTPGPDNTGPGPLKVPVAPPETSP